MILGMEFGIIGTVRLQLAGRTRIRVDLITLTRDYGRKPSSDVARLFRLAGAGLDRTAL
jgi:hypothetical protein